VRAPTSRRLASSRAPAAVARSSRPGVRAVRRRGHRRRPRPPTVRRRTRRLLLAVHLRVVMDQDAKRQVVWYQVSTDGTRSAEDVRADLGGRRQPRRHQAHRV